MADRQVLLRPLRSACVLISSIGWDLTGLFDRTTLLLVIASAAAGLALIWAGLRRPAR